jgi:bifunctional DNA-binding transcriptional regulator/antitoxin component of YhaV-PrlF toxin-antitoxin module
MATKTIDVKVASNGRMILPASVRKAMGLHGDAKVTCSRIHPGRDGA